MVVLTEKGRKSTGAGKKNTEMKYDLKKYIVMVLSLPGLLLLCSCYVHEIYFPIVPECEGRIYDREGRGIANARIRVISYETAADVLTDSQGNFKIGELGQYLVVHSPLRLIPDSLKIWKNDTLFESVGGPTSEFFGELAFFIEVPEKNDIRRFVLIEHNFLPSLYEDVEAVHYSKVYKTRRGFFYCPEVDINKYEKKIKSYKSFLKESAPPHYYIYPPAPLYVPSKNPLDKRYYMCKKQFVFNGKDPESYIVDLDTVKIKFSNSFLTWLFKPRRVMCDRFLFFMVKNNMIDASL
ncbi:MAG: carboxypeptidase regulatory-like domain-containing protein [Lentisphaeria bacterium]|nr:carboxypeptidase regulatory-like domain-containing protein [Lentisphaeria bacterium]